jgi:hypothetical protein
MSHRNKQTENEGTLTEISSKLEEIADKLSMIELKFNLKYLKPTKTSKRVKNLDGLLKLSANTLKIKMLLTYKNKIFCILGLMCALYLLPPHLMHLIRFEV